jgi:signal transduction histidine kinase
MNKYFFALVSLLAVASILFTNLYYGKSSSDKVLASFEQDLKTSAYNNLQAVTPTIRNLLIQGNIREARTILEGWRKNKVFIGYEILEEGKVIDFDLSAMPEAKDEYFIVSIPIKYSQNGPNWGEIKYYNSFAKLRTISHEIESSFNQILLYTTLILICITVAIFIIIWISTDRLAKLFGNYLKDNAEGSKSSLLSMIWGPMILKIDEMSKRATDWRKKYLEAEKSQAMTKVCRQVSHDIRSPLAALNMALEDLDELPESNRVILKMSIQRIQDIANNLLISTNKKNESQEAIPTLLHLTLDEILSEKRLQYKTKMSLKIEGDLVKGQGLFAKVDSGVLKQVLSNIINNSVEAIPTEKGSIILSLNQIGNEAVIEVKDTGMGMSPEVMSNLGKKEFSHGKENLDNSGYGIGLSHAMETVKSWGGDMSIDSVVGEGTTVSIILPLCDSPDWFLSKINCNLGQTVVILDDDHEIHQLWQSKFKPYTENNLLKVVHLNTPLEAKNWFKENGINNILFLTDYELIGFQETGLGIINELKIDAISILVTSHYDEILKSKGDRVLKILPKMIVASTQVQITNADLKISKSEAGILG